MTYTNNQADQLSSEILNNLTDGLDFSLPNIDWDDDKYQIPDSIWKGLKDDLPTITIEELTSRQPRGTGVFDAIMESIANHLKEEYKANRITGAEYTKAYVAMAQASLSNAVQFLLNKDKAKWDALAAQMQALLSAVNFNTAKAQYEVAKSQALLNKAQYANTVIQLAGADAQYAQINKNIEQITHQIQLIDEQIESERAQTLDTRTDGELVEGSVGKQKDLIDKNIEQITHQIQLIDEQMESARAQTLDTRTDEQAVVGSIGKQKELYDQQITAYKRDAELNAAKVFSDAWITQKTIDEGLTAPEMLQNDTVNEVLQTIKTNNKI